MWLWGTPKTSGYGDTIMRRNRVVRRDTHCQLKYRNWTSDAALAVAPFCRTSLQPGGACHDRRYLRHTGIATISSPSSHAVNSPTILGIYDAKKQAAINARHKFKSIFIRKTICKFLQLTASRQVARLMGLELAAYRATGRMKLGNSFILPTPIFYDGSH